MDLELEWDDRKAVTNHEKHGVTFEAAARVFFDKDRIEKLDTHRQYGEDRFVTTGMCRGRLLTVVYTERAEVLRLISARKATRDEELQYHENQTGL